ncbi:Ig-like domain-containing protein [Desulfobacterota bacterium M19]
MAEEEKDDWLDDLDDDAEDTGSDDLDQSDIDSLLNDDDDAASSGNQPESQASQAAPPETVDDGEEQRDSASLPTDDDSTDEDPSQEDIDQLFSEVDDEADKTASTVDDPFQAEEIDFKDLAADIDNEALDEADNGFDAEAFGLDDDDELNDIPDISDDDSTIMEEAAVDEGHEASQVIDKGLDDDEITGEGEAPSSPAKFALPPILQDRKIQAGIGGALILLLAAVFMLRGEPARKTPVSARIPAAASTSPVTKPSPRPVPEVGTAAQNTPPQVSGSSLYIRPGDTDIAITLKASDADHDPLDYEIITLPRHGKLSGRAPNLTYIPDKDFTGKDSIVFRVSDGHNESPAATIQISSIKGKAEGPTATAASETTKPRAVEPNPTVKTAIAKIAANKPFPALKPQTIKPRRLVIAAINAAYSTISTRSLNINWKKLWSKANYLPFSRKTKIEIISSNLHGHLRKISPGHYIYRPDKYFSGTEYIRYRFRLARLKSRARTIKLLIKPGYPPPEIQLGRLAASYVPGERVNIDASATRDEDRKNLIFSWQQIGGTPVKIRLTNQEGSRISFIAPSSFNTIKNPGPVLQLTVVDVDGQRAARKIKIATRSRRNSAVWNEMTVGVREDDY